AMDHYPPPNLSDARNTNFVPAVPQTFRVKESQPPRQIGTSMAHRRWASLSLGQEVSIAPYDPSLESTNIYLGKLDLEVGFLRKTTENKEHFDTEEMSKIFYEVMFYCFCNSLLNH
ncbi:10383_t:CDS:2, partial [Racocetra fulgida]